MQRLKSSPYSHRSRKSKLESSLNNYLLQFSVGLLHPNADQRTSLSALLVPKEIFHPAHPTLLPHRPTRPALERPFLASTASSSERASPSTRTTFALARRFRSTVCAPIATSDSPGSGFLKATSELTPVKR